MQWFMTGLLAVCTAGMAFLSPAGAHRARVAGVEITAPAHNDVYAEDAQFTVQVTHTDLTKGDKVWVALRKASTGAYTSEDYFIVDEPTEVRTAIAKFGKADQYRLITWLDSSPTVNSEITLWAKAAANPGGPGEDPLVRGAVPVRAQRGPAPPVPSLGVTFPGNGNVPSGGIVVTAGYANFAAGWVEFIVTDVTGVPFQQDYDAQLVPAGTGGVSSVTLNLLPNRTYNIKVRSPDNPLAGSDSVTVTTGP